MQNDALSHGLWEMTAPPAPPTSPLEGEVRADVAIIGCGYTGLSTALHLRGGGSQGCRFGGGRDRFRRRGAQRRPGQRRHVARARRCRDEARRPIMASGCSSCSAMDPPRLRRWSTSMGSTANSCATARCIARSGQSGLAKIEERCAQWGARGAPVKLLSREETARRIGVDIYAGSLLDLRAGTIQPLAYARGLARAALAAGAGVHTESPVRSAERTGKAWRLKTGRRKRCGGLDRGRHRRLCRGRALATGEAGADPRALFQFRHASAERRTQDHDPAGARGLLGHADDHELVPFRSGRDGFSSAASARCVSLVSRSTAPGRSARSRRRFRRSARSRSKRNGTE